MFILGKREKTRIKKIIAGLEVEAPTNTLAYAKNKAENWNNFCGVMTFVIPLVLSSVGLVFAELIKWEGSYETIAQLALMLISIIAGFAFHKIASNYRKAAEELNENTNSLKKENLRLNKIIETMKKEQTFLVTFTNQLGVALTNGEKSIAELANLFVANIYCDTIVRFHHNNELTVNLYEIKQNRIRMVGHHQDIFHGEPLLLEKYPDGVDISAVDIKPYFYVQCLKKHDSIITIPNWDGIVKEFYWPNLNKDDLKTKEDCWQAGVTYNQYLGLKLKVGAKKDTIAFMEIISHKDFEIASSEKELKRVARLLYDVYMPVVKVLWNISETNEASVHQEPQLACK